MRIAEYEKKPSWIVPLSFATALVCVALVVWLYFEISSKYQSAVHHGVTAVPLNYRIVSFLNRFAHRSWTLDTFFGLLDSNPLAMAPLVLAFWWAWFRDGEEQARNREYLIYGVVGTLAAVLTVRLVAVSAPFRERPLRNPLLHFQLPYGVNPERLLGWNSFPSDHGALWFALAATVLCVSRRLGILLFLYVSGVLSLARIYLGIHYPGDILAGGLVGIAAISLARFPAIRTRTARPLLQWMESAPQLFYACLFVVTFEMMESFASVVQIGIFVRATAKALIKVL